MVLVVVAVINTKVEVALQIDSTRPGLAWLEANHSYVEVEVQDKQELCRNNGSSKREIGREEFAFR